MFLIVALIVTSFGYAQEERVLSVNDKANTIDAVYYHDNGVVSQKGSYNQAGKLQGEWLKFDSKGNKIASAMYDNGKKVGKWFFWNGNSLTEVDYSNNKITSVNEWQSKSNLASNNP